MGVEESAGHRSATISDQGSVAVTTPVEQRQKTNQLSLLPAVVEPLSTLIMSSVAAASSQLAGEGAIITSTPVIVRLSSQSGEVSVAQ